MPSRTVIALATAAAAVAVPVAAAQAGPTVDRATGGGQTLVDAKGPGNTIAFTAQGTPNGAKGQVRFIDRSAGTGQSQVKFKGDVVCLRVDGNTAEIGGFERDTGQPFNLFVTDNGEGRRVERDLIGFNNTDADGQCDGNDDENPQPDVKLARGNAKVVDATP